MNEELKLYATVKEMIEQKLIKPAHEVADRSLYITLLESAMPHEPGFDFMTDSNFRKMLIYSERVWPRGSFGNSNAGGLI